MLKCTYIVERIDGDYAMLRREDETDQNAEPKMTARALLPPEIMEGIGMAGGTLRFSLSRFTTEEEVEQVLQAVRDVVESSI